MTEVLDVDESAAAVRVVRPGHVIVATIGFLIAGVLPFPLGPNSSVTEVVGFYSDSTRVAAGLVIAGLGVCLVFPLIALIGVYLVRMEGRTPSWRSCS
jgi:hypothetical protein